MGRGEDGGVAYCRQEGQCSFSLLQRIMINSKNCQDGQREWLYRYVEAVVGLYERGRKLKAVSSPAGLSLDRLWVAGPGSALEAKELEYQKLPGLATENTTLRTEASRPRDSVGTLGR